MGYISEILWTSFVALSLAAFGILMFLFFPEHVDRTRRSIVAKPVQSGGAGLLTLFVIMPLIFFFSITILLIPLGFVVFLFLLNAAMFGWIALGMEVGMRLGKNLAREWGGGVSMGLGTLLLTLTVYGFGFIFDFIPCIGWILPSFIILIGLGAVVLSRFGAREYLI